MSLSDKIFLRACHISKIVGNVVQNRSRTTSPLFEVTLESTGFVSCDNFIYPFTLTGVAHLDVGLGDILDGNEEENDSSRLIFNWH